MPRINPKTVATSLGLPWPPRWTLSLFEVLFLGPTFFMAVAFELRSDAFGKQGIPLSLPAWVGGIRNFQPKLFPMEIFLLWTALLTLSQFRRLGWGAIRKPVVRLAVALFTFGLLRALPDLRENVLLVVRNSAFVWYLSLPLLITLAPISSLKWEQFFRALYVFSFAYFVLCLFYPLYMREAGNIFWFIDLGLMFGLAYGLCSTRKWVARGTLVAIGFVLGLSYFSSIQRTTLIGLLLTGGLLFASPIFFGTFPRPRWRRVAWMVVGLGSCVATVGAMRAYRNGNLTSLIQEVSTAVSSAKPERRSETNERGLEKFRYYLWLDAWNAFTAHPLIGNGFLKPIVYRVYAGDGKFVPNDGSFEYASQGNFEKTTAPISGPHNSYLNALARLGIFGLGFLILHLACAWLFLTRCYFACFFILLWQMLYAFFNVGLEGPIRSFPLLVLVGVGLKLAAENVKFETITEVVVRKVKRTAGRAGRVGLVHVPYRFLGGEDRHVEVLHDAYKAIGIDPVRIPDSGNESGILFSAARSLTAGSPQAWDTLLKRQGIEFLHLNNIHAALGPAFLRWIVARGVPTLMTVHNHRFYCTNGLALYGAHVCKDCRAKPSFLRPIARNCNGSLPKTIYHSAAMMEIRGNDLLQRAVTQFLAPSPYIARELQSAGIPAESIRVFPHPVDVRNAGPAPAEGVDVAFIGRLSAEKGVSYLLNAAEKLPTRTFAIVGEGPLEAEVRERARKLPNVKYLGKMEQAEALALMRGARVVCVPSICHESFSLVAAEALSLGARLVLPDTQSFLHFLEAPFNSVLANVTNPESLAYSLEMALELPRRSAEETTAIRDRFGLERFQERLKQVTEEIVYERQAPACP